MRSKRILAASLVGVPVLLNPATSRADDTNMVQAVVISYDDPTQGLSSTLQYQFKSAQPVDWVKTEMFEDFGIAQSIQDGSTLRASDVTVTVLNPTGSVPIADSPTETVAEAAGTLNQPEAGGQTYKKIFCDEYYTATDSSGSESFLRVCGDQSPLWSFRLSPSLAKACEGTYSDTGQRWTKNLSGSFYFGSQTAACDKSISGTFYPAGLNDKIDYNDTYFFEVNLGGREAMANLDTKGHLWFKGRTPS